MRMMTITGDEDYLHMYTFGASPLVRTVRMRPPSLRCVACGPDATLTTDLEKMDYEAFCAGPSVVGAREGATNARDAPRTDRISPAELREVLRSAGSGAGGSSGGDAMANGGNALASVRVVDTRSETEFGICSLPGCISEDRSWRVSRGLTLQTSRSNRSRRTHHESSVRGKVSARWISWSLFAGKATTRSSPPDWLLLRKPARRTLRFASQTFEAVWSDGARR